MANGSRRQGGGVVIRTRQNATTRLLRFRPCVFMGAGHDADLKCGVVARVKGKTAGWRCLIKPACLPRKPGNAVWEMGDLRCLICLSGNRETPHQRHTRIGAGGVLLLPGTVRHIRQLGWYSCGTVPSSDLRLLSVVCQSVSILVKTVSAYPAYWSKLSVHIPCRVTIISHPTMDKCLP